MSIAARLSSSVGTNDPMKAPNHARGEPSVSATHARSRRIDRSAT